MPTRTADLDAPFPALVFLSLGFLRRRSLNNDQINNEQHNTAVGPTRIIGGKHRKSGMFGVKDWALAAMALYEDIMQVRDTLAEDRGGNRQDECMLPM